MFDPTLSNLPYSDFLTTSTDLDLKYIGTPTSDPLVNGKSSKNSSSLSYSYDRKTIEETILNLSQKVATQYNNTSYSSDQLNNFGSVDLTNSRGINNSQSDYAGNSLTNARVIPVNTTATNYTDWVGTTDTNDYYRFSITQSSKINLSLTGLTNDAELQLLDSAGNNLINSTNYGTTNESISGAQLLTGTYYIRGSNLRRDRMHSKGFRLLNFFRLSRSR